MLSVSNQDVGQVTSVQSGRGRPAKHLTTKSDASPVGLASAAIDPPRPGGSAQTVPPARQGIADLVLQQPNVASKLYLKPNTKTPPIVCTELIISYLAFHSSMSKAFF